MPVGHSVDMARSAIRRLGTLPAYCGYDRGVDGVLMESWDHRSAYQFQSWRGGNIC